MKFPSTLLLIIALVVSLTSCLGQNSEPTQSPPWPTGGWQVSTPEEQGLDSEILAEMFQEIEEENYAIDQVTIVRNGYMIADAPIYPYQPNSKHPVYSVTKSVVSALIGLAIEEGHISSVDQPILDFFPERDVSNLDPVKESITLENLLTMSSGLKCEDSYLHRWRGLNQIQASDDWIQFVLDLPIAEEPGTYFEYCNGASFLLSAIIQETTGISALSYAETHLFGPLGITDVLWSENPQGISIGWAGIYMGPHDMAKIGYLYLNNGKWEDQQIIPSDWVAKSTRNHIDASTLENSYGYQWWVTDEGNYMALGYRGQYIVVVPEENLVVVFVSTLPDHDFYVPKVLLYNYILPSVRSSSPLPENPQGATDLEAIINALAGQ
jgi:CubicO group peptidase (beta-lactamase class C family)